MSKLQRSHARTQNGNPQPKRPWYGQDNLNLRAGYFDTLSRWLDVDHLHHPVKDYAQALNEVLIDMATANGKRHAGLYSKVFELREDLISLDRQIDTLMKKGGPGCN